MSYTVFKRTCTNWRTFASARKITQETGLTWEEAKRCVDRMNAERTKAQIRRGTCYEFQAS